MRIAQVAPLYESVPPKYYGGTERVVSYLTEELVRQGHQVTLFASGDSITKARLVAACPRSLRLDKRVDQEYFANAIKPLLGDPLVELVGEIGDEEKDSFLGDAYALLLPIDWPEPFGLVMIEAMACGTPVIAYRGGAIPEIMEEGHTGFIVRALKDAVEAVRRVPELRRKRCREVFEKRFTAARMAQDYVQVYKRLINNRQDKVLGVRA
jgi:glycosyltransferase involved in cell wall biosynthesis